MLYIMDGQSLMHPVATASKKEIKVHYILNTLQ